MLPWLTTAQASSPTLQLTPAVLRKASERFMAAQEAGPPLRFATGLFCALVQEVSHLYTLIPGLPPPLVNAETEKMSPFECTPGPNDKSLWGPIFCWKNQTPILESPFVA